MLDYLHTLTIPTPFPVGPVNGYLIASDPLTLIDTGPKDTPTRDALREQLRARGFALRDLRRIIVTHAHVDHMGLAAQIVAESGAQVLSHARNRWWLTDFHNEWERRYDFYRAVARQSGAPPDYADRVVQGMRIFSRYADPIPAENFVALEEGDEIALGGDAWRVVFAPGHAGGLICLHDPRSRALISSDHLLRDITSNPVLEPPAHDATARPRALVDYMASMEKTVRLDPQLILPGHGEPIYDVRALVDARLAFHRARLDHIEAQLGCCAGTAYELCGVLFPKLKSFDVFLGLSEVIGHLDVLELEGRVRREMDHDVIRYVPVKRETRTSAE